MDKLFMVAVLGLVAYSVLSKKTSTPTVMVDTPWGNVFSSPSWKGTEIPNAELLPDYTWAWSKGVFMQIPRTVGVD